MPGGAWVGMQAQTAHFAWAQTVVASGLNYPTGVAVDGSGNIYIADTSNRQVLKETLSAGSYNQSVVNSCGAVVLCRHPSRLVSDGAGRSRLDRGRGGNIPAHRIVDPGQRDRNCSGRRLDRLRAHRRRSGPHSAGDAGGNPGNHWTWCLVNRCPAFRQKALHHPRPLATPMPP